MDIKQTIKEAKAKLGKPKPRRTPGFWIPYSRAVRELVDRGYGVTESAREVLVANGLMPDDAAISCVRAAYYKLREKEVA